MPLARVPGQLFDAPVDHAGGRRGCLCAPLAWTTAPTGIAASQPNLALTERFRSLRRDRDCSTAMADDGGTGRGASDPHQTARSAPARDPRRSADSGGVPVGIVTISHEMGAGGSV